MRHGSLFSGIGGFDLAAEWMGWENMFHCEWNQFGQKVLKYYWPNAISYDDICKTDFTIWNGRIDILTGGFPCQPYSMAGKRQGTEDARHLWPEMLRAIRECRPTWIVGENVPGLINWSGGLVFEGIQSDLEGEGYEVQSVVLGAGSINAPHKRKRLFAIAYSDSVRREGRENGSNSTGGEWQGNSKVKPKRLCERNYWDKNWSGIDTILEFYNDGIPKGLDGITFPKWRNESIKAGGNAIVPQVALQIFKVIEQIQNETTQ